jgi:hypothetical protein
MAMSLLVIKGSRVTLNTVPRDRTGFFAGDFLELTFVPAGMFVDFAPSEAFEPQCYVFSPVCTNNSTLLYNSC